jgi:hypothetical protein
LPSPAGIPGTGIVKIFFLLVEAVAEDIGTVENKIRVVNQIDHTGGAGHGEESRGLVAVAVEQLMPRI